MKFTDNIINKKHDSQKENLQDFLNN